MPLTLRPPRASKTPNWEIRGTHFGVRVETSARTADERKARKALRDLEDAIERGEYPPREQPKRTDEPTFLSAALAYMEAGRSRRYVGKILNHFGETPICEIDQAAIDAAAVVLYPRVQPATRNTCFYTPLSAILHYHYGDNLPFPLRRPKGAKGRVITDFLTPEDAAAVIKAGTALDAELGLLLRFLLYTGVRINEALGLRWELVLLDEASARIRTSKNEDPRELRLRADLLADLRAHKGKTEFGPIFRWRYGGRLKDLLLEAKLSACGKKMPPRGKKRRLPAYRLDWVTFHTFRHTWASWMRRYGGTDTKGLVATGNWRDERSAARYAHAVARDEWSRVDILPAVGESKGN